MSNLVNGHKVHFEYGEKSVNYFSKGKAKTAIRPTIKCVISKNDQVISEKTVAPHHTDRENKYVGRFYAFRKAADNIVDKTLKKELFNSYLEEMRLS